MTRRTAPTTADCTTDEPPLKDPERRQDPEPYLRPENEDDDGYDPYSDRPAAPEPLFERDPWS